MDYAELGSIARLRGDFAQAETLYNKSLQKAAKAGYRGLAAEAYQDLGLLAFCRGDLPLAVQLYRRAHTLYLNLGMTGKVEELNRMFSELKIEESAPPEAPGSALRA